MCTTAGSSSGVESSFNYIYNIMTLDVDAVNVTWGRYFVSFPSSYHMFHYDEKYYFIRFLVERLPTEL